MTTGIEVGWTIGLVWDVLLLLEKTYLGMQLERRGHSTTDCPLEIIQMKSISQVTVPRMLSHKGKTYKSIFHRRVANRKESYRQVFYWKLSHRRSSCRTLSRRKIAHRKVCLW